MKIIQVMPEFGLAGAETMCENLTYELRKLGHEVIILSLYDYHSPITERLEKAGINIRYLGKKTGFDLLMIVKLRRIFVQEKPDVIHTHRYVMSYAIPAAVLAGVKRCVHTVHSIATKEVSKNTRHLNKLFYRFVGVTPVALSEIIKDTILEEYSLPENKVGMVYNGVSLDKCQVKEEYTFKSETIDIVHIGRFSVAKNHEKMIDAVCQVHDRNPRVRLSLYGDGEKKEQIKQYICSKNAEEFVLMRGLTDNVFPLLRAADLFILPSIYEGIPMTIAEAMGAAVPIVASRVGGIPDMIEDGRSGLLCDPTSDDIANKIELMIADENLRERCGKEALKGAEKFSAKSMALGYEAVYTRKL